MVLHLPCQRAGTNLVQGVLGLGVLPLWRMGDSTEGANTHTHTHSLNTKVRTRIHTCIWKGTEADIDANAKPEYHEATDTLATFVVIKLTMCLLFVTYLANKHNTCPTPLFVAKLRTHLLLVSYLAYLCDACLTTFVIIERTMGLLLIAYLAHPRDACLTTFVVIKLTMCLLFVTYLANKHDTCLTALLVEKRRTPSPCCISCTPA